jgi:hypothetical protein
VAELFDDAVTAYGEDETPTRTRKETSFLIPWSCRESFTNNVCGLPGSEEGCRRHRDSIGNQNIEYKGIPPWSEAQAEDSEGHFEAWIVFQREADDSNLHRGIEVIAHQEKPAYSKHHHQVFFGISRNGIEARSEKNEFFPSYIEYRGIDKDAGESVNIKDWLNEDGSRGPSLSDCFGSYTFEVKPIKIPELGININLSLADLINAYLNNNQENCVFRYKPSYRDLGITKCKVELKLSSVFFKGEKIDLLNDSAITFSYVDPSSLTIKRLEDQYLGQLDVDPSDSDDYNDPNDHNKIKNLSEDCFQPLSISITANKRDSEEVNFAYSLSKRGRQQVHPAEVGRSFLRFPIGEISTYLLHWFLLRIFAHESEINREFVRRFCLWRESDKEANSEHRLLFKELLDTPVILPLEPNIFKEKVVGEGIPCGDLGIYQTATLFSEVLTTLDLSPHHGRSYHGLWLEATVQFLSNYFNPSSSDQSLASLPMYRFVDWRKSSLLNGISERPFDAEAYLEAIVDSIAEGSGLRADAGKASEELIKHSRRCVFPIADVLSHISSNHVKPLYYIFPLWDDRFGDWEGPVIFAHVFTSALHPKENSRVEEEDISELGATLHNLLIPFGSAIAHTYYNEERKKIGDLDLAQKAAWTQASAWAHEVKNYTGPIIDYLDSRALKNEEIVTSPEARQIIRRSREALLILNAASKAMQLAILNRPGVGEVEERDRLTKLSRENARQVVEWALQYLLNYHAETHRNDFILNWSPQYSNDEVIKNLAGVLKADDKRDVYKAVLTNHKIIWVIALLREVVGNIRINVPITTTGEIKLSYVLQIDDDELHLTLVQQHIEVKGWSENKNISRGIVLANELFGERGAGYGSIRIEPPVNNELGGRRGVEIIYTVHVNFAVS